MPRPPDREEDLFSAQSNDRINFHPSSHSSRRRGSLTLLILFFFEIIERLVMIPIWIAQQLFSSIAQTLKALIEIVSLADSYIFNLVTSIVNHYRKKMIRILMEFSLIPFNLAISAIEMICFSIFVGAPAYRFGRSLYRKDSQLIAKNLRYGSRQAQVLDVYLLPEQQRKDSSTPAPQVPVLLFVQGGGWTICQKALYPALGRALRSKGFVTVVPDYTAFPQGDISVMLEDIKGAIAWTIANIDKYGGNPNKIILCGNSAGAHLCSLALLTELESHLRRSSSQVSLTGQDMGKSKSAPSFSSLQEEMQWSYSGIKAFIGVSGPFNVPELFQNMIVEGKEKFSGLSDIMKGKENFEKFSPYHILEKFVANNKSLEVSMNLPPFTLIHGSSDKTCPLQSVSDFDRLLRQVGVHGKLLIYQNQSHLESIMEVLEGFENARLVVDIVKVIQSGTVIESIDENKSWSWKFRRMIMRSLSPV